MHDSQAAIALARLTAIRADSLYDLMDSACDVPEIRACSQKLGSVPIIDSRRRAEEKAERKREALAERCIDRLSPQARRYRERSTLGGRTDCSRWSLGVAGEGARPGQGEVPPFVRRPGADDKTVDAPDALGASPRRTRQRFFRRRVGAAQAAPEPRKRRESNHHIQAFPFKRVLAVGSSPALLHLCQPI